MADIHTVAECSKKLVVLLDKIKVLEVPKGNPLYANEIADIKVLAREINNESEFVSGIR